MRIITGKHKGRKLLDFRKLKNLRPTTDKNREALFNILSLASFLKEIGFDLTKCDLLDVFSGTGSISFEALSRGVRSATLIDRDFKHIELSKKNAETLKEERNCSFITFDLTKPLFQSDKQYNLIYIDPPYEKGLIKPGLENLLKHNFIAKNALIITESSSFENMDLDDLKELKLLTQKKYSRTVFSFFIHNNVSK